MLIHFSQSLKLENYFFQVSHILSQNKAVLREEVKKSKVSSSPKQNQLKQLELLHFMLTRPSLEYVVMPTLHL